MQDQLRIDQSKKKKKVFFNEKFSQNNLGETHLLWSKLENASFAVIKRIYDTSLRYR